MSEKKVKLLALCILCTPLACSAQDFSPEFVRDVFLNLDMTSFPNSWGPQHFPEGTTMKDILKKRGEYEIKECENKKNCTVIHFPYHIKDSTYKDDGWYNYLKIIKQEKGKILVCFSDINGWGNYNVTEPLELKKIKGKFVVTHEYNQSIKGCDYYNDDR